MALKRLALGGLQDTPPRAQKVYPRLDTAEGRRLVDEFIKRSAELDSIISLVDDIKERLKDMARKPYFEYCAGKVDIPSSMEVVGNNGSVLIETKKVSPGLPATDESLQVLASIIGVELVETAFMQTAILKVDTSKIAPDKIEPLFAELSAVFKRHGCEDAISLKTVIKPTDEWFSRRHLPMNDAEKQNAGLIVERNLRVHQIAPFVEAAKIKSILKG